MSTWNSILFIGFILSAFFLYDVFSKEKNQITVQQGMNIAVVMGGGLPVGIGLILIAEYPFHYLEVSIGIAMVGMIAGGLFGALSNEQSMLFGFSTGFMTGIMAPMIGAAASYSQSFVYTIAIFIISSFFILYYTVRQANNE